MKEVLLTFDVDTVFSIEGWLEIARVRSARWSTFYVIATRWFCFSTGGP
jgi:hypothetical protein